RVQLRRVGCRDVTRLQEGKDTSFVLLNRKHSSLVPYVAASVSTPSVGAKVADTENVEASSSSAQAMASGESDVGHQASPEVEGKHLLDLGGGSLGADESPCPSEGHILERFSRLVMARPSKLIARAEAERAELQHFREKCLQGGDTEWLPFVSQAQLLVTDQLALLQEEERAERRAKPSSHNVGYTPEHSHKQGMPRDEAEHHASGDSSIDSGRKVQQPAVNKNTTRGGATSSRSLLSSLGQTPQSPLNSKSVQHEGTASPTPLPKEQVGGSEGGGDGKEGTGKGGGGEGQANTPFRFYQSFDGQKAFLHPLNMRCLLEECGSSETLPEYLTAPVVEVETVKLTYEMRKRLPFLGHLPEHCDISFVELEMDSFISQKTRTKFAEEICKRQRNRRRRRAQENSVAAAEAKAEAKRRAKIAAMITATVDLEGPLPGALASSKSSTSRSAPQMVDPLPHEALQQGDSNARLSDEYANSERVGDDVGSHRDVEPQDSRPRNKDREGSRRYQSLGGAVGGEASMTGGEGEGGWSFARVTAMNGHFPTLGR
ncbi:unnamed protein product, partial [Choristocarpus tenellus]